MTFEAEIDEYSLPLAPVLASNSLELKTKSTCQVDRIYQESPKGRIIQFKFERNICQCEIKKKNSWD
jgi:hypothetical protein